MTRSFPPLRRRSKLIEVRSQFRGFVEEGRGTKVDSRSSSNRRVLAIDHQKKSAQKLLDDGLTSVLLSQDKDFAQILQEVDEISKHLKANSPDIRALGEALHRSVLCAIKHSILERELRSLALKDDLTSLYNRRGFFALAAQQLKVTRRKSQGLLLFFADVDHLKQINDAYGHGEGDLALTRTAAALERTFRNSDVLARLGGDEFAVLALEASSEDQETILRRLERHLQEVSAEERRYDLSVSVGVARLDPKQSSSLGDLLAKADRAMYEAKGTHSKVWMSRP
jgi:diguanylate cyclase (GGDEF)-like protein